MKLKTSSLYLTRDWNLCLAVGLSEQLLSLFRHCATKCSVLSSRETEREKEKEREKDREADQSGIFADTSF
jgi:hypothetical protein